MRTRGPERQSHRPAGKGLRLTSGRAESWENPKVTSRCPGGGISHSGWAHPAPRPGASCIPLCCSVPTGIWGDGEWWPDSPPAPTPRSGKGRAHRQETQPSRTSLPGSPRQTRWVAGKPRPRTASPGGSPAFLCLPSSWLAGWNHSGLLLLLLNFIKKKAIWTLIPPRCRGLCCVYACASQRAGYKAEAVLWGKMRSQPEPQRAGFQCIWGYLQPPILLVFPK